MVLLDNIYIIADLGIYLICLGAIGVTIGGISMFFLYIFVCMVLDVVKLLARIVN